MTEQRDNPDDEHFSDWLFYRRRTPHRPRRHSSYSRREQEEK